MNTTFLAWLTVAAVVGGAVLLFLGMPTGEQAGALALENAPAESADYWDPVTPVEAIPVSVQYVTTSSQPIQPCGSCGTVLSAPTTPVRVQQSRAKRCGVCGALQATSPISPGSTQGPHAHSCVSCGTTGTPSAVPIYMQYPQMASCEQRVPSPCGSTTCSSLPTYCGKPCGNTCPLDKPGINRNMDLCVEECTFVQLHTTIPHPICSDVRFEWTTSKGSFLEANVANPIYYVPTTQFADGEDVWVVVTITDSHGAKYTDQLKLHVINQR